MRLRPALLFGLLAAISGLLKAEDRPTITAIEIRIVDVFSKREAETALIPYRLANFLHVETRESVIRQYLLFKEGDPLDPESLAETERNLRATRLFRQVTVWAEGTKVIVETDDTWTLIPRINLSRRAAILEYSAGLEEGNLLGTGRDLAIRYDKEAQRLARSVSYEDRNFVLPYTDFLVATSNLSDGREYDASVQRPFFALDTLQAVTLSYHQSRLDETLYASGDPYAIWSQRQRSFLAQAGVRIFYDGDRATRLYGSVEWDDTDLGPKGFGPPPPPWPPRQFLFFSAAVETDGRGWIQQQHIDELARVEDFNLAPYGRLEIGLSPDVFDAVKAARIRTQGRIGASLPWGFATFTLNGETRIQDGFRNALLSGEARANQVRGRLTLVTRLSFMGGWRMDPENQIQLDGANGVRGYNLYAVSGTERLVGNLEGRLFVAGDVLHLVSFGLAGFADLGLSWGPPDGTWQLADVGGGFRFGLDRASKNTLLRLDIARALRADPLGRTGWLVSFSSGQEF